MKYFIDTEFLEGTQTPNFFLKGRLGNLIGAYKKPTIDLISIGIVAEDNREYYAISKEFNLEEAWNRYDLLEANTNKNHSLNNRRIYWIRENVLEPIYKELLKKENSSNIKGNYMFGFNLPVIKYDFTYKNLKKLLSKYGKTNKQIAFEIVNFIHGYNNIGNWLGTTEEYYNNIIKIEPKNKPQFYGYYADYDWVVFCWLFGKMNNLPAGFPMYCIDLKQISDEVYQQKKKEVLDEAYKKGMKLCFLNSLSEHLKYPKQTNEHNALADARWNRELHKFLNEL